MGESGGHVLPGSSLLGHLGLQRRLDMKRIVSHCLKERKKGNHLVPSELDARFIKPWDGRS